MTSFEINIRTFWNYYIELEKEYYETKKFVEFCKSNYNTFSIEFLKLYQAVCAEIDSIGKYLANQIDSSFVPKDSKGINAWWIIIQDQVLISEEMWEPDISKRKRLDEFELFSNLLAENLKPWNGYHVEYYVDVKGTRRIKLSPGKETPAWWNSYNKVKHLRTEIAPNGEMNYSKANLINLSNAIAALYMLELATLQLSGNQDELESFFNESLVHIQKKFMTTEEIDNLF